LLCKEIGGSLYTGFLLYKEILIFFTYFFGIPNLGNFLGVAGVSGRDFAKT